MISVRLASGFFVSGAAAGPPTFLRLKFLLQRKLHNVNNLDPREHVKKLTKNTVKQRDLFYIGMKQTFKQQISKHDHKTTFSLHLIKILAVIKEIN